MTHPTINHIGDVLPAIAGRKDFIVAEKDGYTVVDYVYTTDDSFDCPIRRECRGLKFAPDGKILARPLHKFFNVNERPETQAHLLDFSQPHLVMEKLDGSMIHPAIIDGEVVFMTRMGRTDVARKAERHLNEEVRRACRRFLQFGLTPIYEFTAPDNRIVIKYDASGLTLLAARDTVSGQYLPHITGSGTVPIRSTWPGVIGHEFAEYARTITGIEGFVVRFKDGTWVKAKGEDYVLKHKAKDSILQEKNLLQLILAGGVDDVLPLLEPDDADAVTRYRDNVWRGIADTVIGLTDFVAANDNLSQKDFATGPIASLQAHLRPLAFAVRSGRPASNVVMDTIKTKVTTQARVDELRPLFRAKWVA